MARFSKEIYIALLSLLGLFTHIVLRFTDPPHAHWPLLAILFAGGAPLLFDLFGNIFAGDIGSDLLAGISIVVSLLLGEYLAGAIIVLMLAGGTGLEQYASRRASSVLASLARRMPRIAHRIDGVQIKDVPLDELNVNDKVSVFPHEICPVDGVIEEGHGSMDESYLTGEPFQITKGPGAAELSGAINGETALRVTVTNLPADSRYAKIMLVMREAEQNRPKLRRLADRLGAWYTLAAILAASAGWAASSDPKRFLAVLVIATPCPLLLAIPITIMGAISAAANRSIIIKNPGMLEELDSCRTVIFDKTGTLTYGKPSLTGTQTAAPLTEDEALQLAASMEQYSKHPLAASLLSAARDRAIALHPADEITEKPGEGLSGIVQSVKLRIVSRKQALDHGVPAAVLPPQVPGMECILIRDGAYAAAFRFQDAPRHDSHSFIRHLGPRHQIDRLMLLSGDREAEVRYLAGQVGIKEIYFSKSPEQKLEIVREETRRAHVMFLGDGINDAPSMQAATVGIAFGPNCDITAEAADAVVLVASLEKVDQLIHIGRRMRRIALESAVGGMALSMIGMLLAACGYLTPVAGAITQELIDAAAAVLNALRMTLPTKDLQDY